MKLKRGLTVVLFLSSLLGLNNLNIVFAANSEESSPIAKYDSEYNVSYYSDIKGLKGDSLLEGLASISFNNHKYYTTYNDLKGALTYSDEDPNDSTKIIDFYTGWSINNEWSPSASSDYINPWNREHVWCKSLSNSTFVESGAGSDIHHIRPENTRINSARNNGLFKDLDESYRYYYLNDTTGENIDTGCYRDKESYFEPRDEVKGDVARILMYLYMHYSIEVSFNNKNNPYEFNGNLVITNIVSTDENTDTAAWKLLLDWNKLDAVDTFEKNRNNYCASITGVRNPFIDHSEFANMIWDSEYSGDGALNDANLPSTPDVDEPIDPIEPENPIESTNKTYTFNEYATGTQYAQNESHILDNDVTIVTNQCHFTSELRVYASSTHDGNVIIKSNKKINKIDLNIGYNTDTLNVYNENNILIGSITTSSSTYSDYSLNISPSLNYIKLDVKGANQLRIKSMTLYFDVDEISSIKEKIKELKTEAQLDFSYNYQKGNEKKDTAYSIVKEDVKMTDSATNYAEYMNLDSSIYNVTFIKGNPSTNLTLKNDGTIRIYADRNTGIGNTLVVELKNTSNKIKSISFTDTKSATLTVKDSKGNVINLTNNEYQINDYKFTIQNTQYAPSSSSNINAFINELNINCSEETIYSNFNTVNIRYRAIISNEIFENIDSYGINIKVNGDNKDYAISEVNDNGDNKEFALVLRNIKDYTIEITATAYVYINNEKVTLESKTYSVLTMIDYYILNSTSLKLSSSQIEALNAFKESV